MLELGSDRYFTRDFEWNAVPSILTSIAKTLYRVLLAYVLALTVLLISFLPVPGTQYQETDTCQTIYILIRRMNCCLVKKMCHFM